MAMAVQSAILAVLATLSGACSPQPREAAPDAAPSEAAGPLADAAPAGAAGAPPGDPAQGAAPCPQADVRAGDHIIRVSRLDCGSIAPLPPPPQPTPMAPLPPAPPAAGQSQRGRSIACSSLSAR